MFPSVVCPCVAFGTPFRWLATCGVPYFSPSGSSKGLLEISQGRQASRVAGFGVFQHLECSFQISLRWKMKLHLKKRSGKSLDTFEVAAECTVSEFKQLFYQKCMFRSVYVTSEYTKPCGTATCASYRP